MAELAGSGLGQELAVLASDLIVKGLASIVPSLGHAAVHNILSSQGLLAKPKQGKATVLRERERERVQEESWDAQVLTRRDGCPFVVQQDQWSSWSTV